MGLKSVFVALSLSLVCLAPQVSFADTVTLTGVGGASSDGVFTYPYLFTVTNSGGSLQNFAMTCLNFDREITIGESWTANAVSVLSIGISGIDNETKKSFIEDAWLYDQYASASGNAQQISDIQFAIWNIMDPSVATKGLNGYTNNAATLDGQALASYNSGNFSFAANDVVYIPTAWPDNAGEPQIFMADPPAATPEPSGLVLLGTGLLGTVGFLRRRLLSA